jgi:hypothetical protein
LRGFTWLNRYVGSAGGDGAESDVEGGEGAGGMLVKVLVKVPGEDAGEGSGKSAGDGARKR